MEKQENKMGNKKLKRQKPNRVLYCVYIENTLNFIYLSYVTTHNPHGVRRSHKHANKHTHGGYYVFVYIFI